MRHQAGSWGAPPSAPPPGAAARVAGGVMLPVFTVLSAVWFAAMALVVLSLWWTYDRMGFTTWPPGDWPWMLDVPRWVVIVTVIAVYALLALPLGAARRTALYYANGGRLHGWADAWSGLLWIAVVGLIVLAAWQMLPHLQGWWMPHSPAVLHL